jgi:adenine-specific DNA methylase
MRVGERPLASTSSVSGFLTALRQGAWIVCNRALTNHRRCSQVRRMSNHLYYGDNLDILRSSIADESVDLVYLDPPFNSQANYNVLFKAPSGQQSDRGFRGYVALE